MNGGYEVANGVGKLRGAGSQYVWLLIQCRCRAELMIRYDVIVEALNMTPHLPGEEQ
jgi:hypothetical protein